RLLTYGQAILFRHREDLKSEIMLADTATGKDYLNEAVRLFPLLCGVQSPHRPQSERARLRHSGDSPAAQRSEQARLSARQPPRAGPCARGWRPHPDPIDGDPRISRRDTPRAAVLAETAG